MPWLHLSTLARNAAMNAVADLIDAGGTGSVKIYSGTGPANADSAATGTLLATVDFNASADAFGDAINGVVSANALQSATGLADADAGWARVVNGSGNTILDLDISATSATLVLDPIGIVPDAEVSITSATLTMPSGV